MQKRNKYFSFALLAFIFIVSCNKSTIDRVPNHYIDVTIFLDDPRYINLKAPGGVSLIYPNYTGNGVVLYRQNNDSYLALERTCTYKPLDSCSILDLDSGGSLWLNCRCCESRFTLDGAILKTPAQLPLKQYTTQYILSTNSLRIYN